MSSLVTDILKAAGSRLYLLQQADHVGVLAHSQAQRHGQILLILKTTGVELWPELHLQLTILLLRKLKFCHAALQLREDREEKTLLPTADRLIVLKMTAEMHKAETEDKVEDMLPHSPRLLSPLSLECPRTRQWSSLSLCGRSETGSSVNYSM